MNKLGMVAMGLALSAQEGCLLGVERNCHNENTVALEVLDLGQEGDIRIECVDPYLLDLGTVIGKFNQRNLEVLSCVPSHEEGYRDLTAEDIDALEGKCEEVGL